ncbi:hypothetical protein OSO01_36500 [Oceanobacillus sojae]|uniref:Uncharacterized protein n=1 Tax=Oceanobacillus sojae TaxID=582851 RepID=A0A511ZN81_9BACI|nr:hypothetical protein OSO01_36500 [Oceanobacillus sojae]
MKVKRRALVNAVLSRSSILLPVINSIASCLDCTFLVINISINMKQEEIMSIIIVRKKTNNQNAKGSDEIIGYIS